MNRVTWLIALLLAGCSSIRSRPTGDPRIAAAMRNRTCSGLPSEPAGATDAQLRYVLSCWRADGVGDSDLCLGLKEFATPGLLPEIFEILRRWPPIKPQNTSWGFIDTTMHCVCAARRADPCFTMKRHAANWGINWLAWLEDGAPGDAPDCGSPRVPSPWCAPN
jgi:hypothetical protein